MGTTPSPVVPFVRKVRAVPMITVTQDELAGNGYTEVVSQDDDEVVLRNEEGGLEVFIVRDDFAGWSISTDDGRVLEFCRSI